MHTSVDTHRGLVVPSVGPAQIFSSKFKPLIFSTAAHIYLARNLSVSSTLQSSPIVRKVSSPQQPSCPVDPGGGIGGLDEPQRRRSKHNREHHAHRRVYHKVCDPFDLRILLRHTYPFNWCHVLYLAIHVVNRSSSVWRIQPMDYRYRSVYMVYDLL